MANKEKIDYLLLDIKELETLIAGMRDAEVYPVSFFSQTFNLTHKILNDLHSLETAQIEMLRKQMEAHQALIQSLPGCHRGTRSRRIQSGSKRTGNKRRAGRRTRDRSGAKDGTRAGSYHRKDGNRHRAVRTSP